MPAIGVYSASKGALERWAESLAYEISPFGLGVTVLVSGMFRTDMLEVTPSYAITGGAYETFHTAMEARGRKLIRLAGKHRRFAKALERAVNDQASFVRRTVGFDARMMLLATRAIPTRAFRTMAATATGLPRTIDGESANGSRPD